MSLITEDSEKREELGLINASKDDGNYIENAIQFNKQQEEQRQKFRQSTDVPVSMDGTSATAHHPLPSNRLSGGANVVALPTIAENETISSASTEAPRTVTHPAILSTSQPFVPATLTVAEQRIPLTLSESTPPSASATAAENAAITSTPVVRPGSAFKTPSVSPIAESLSKSDLQKGDVGTPKKGGGKKGKKKRPTSWPKRTIPTPAKTSLSPERTKFSPPTTPSRTEEETLPPPLSGEDRQAQVQRRKELLRAMKNSPISKSLTKPDSRGKFTCSFSDCKKEFSAQAAIANHFIDSHLEDMSNLERESARLFTPRFKTRPRARAPPAKPRQSRFRSRTRSIRTEETKSESGQYSTDFERYAKGSRPSSKTKSGGSRASLKTESGGSRASSKTKSKGSRTPPKKTKSGRVVKKPDKLSPSFK